MINQIYRESFATIKESRYCILSVAVIYIGAIFVGWLYSESFPFIEQQAKELAKGFVDKTAFVFIIKVFFRNLMASYIVACIISLWGFVPLLAAAANGLLLGWIISFAAQATFSQLAILLIPHGVFEWPAMFIAWGIGLWKGLGFRLQSSVLSFGERFKMVNVVYFTTVLPLLIVAAIIEGRYHISKEIFG